MSFPLVEDAVTSSEPTGTTTHSVALPPGIAPNELLIALIGGRELFGDIPSGWTRPVYMAHSSDTDCTDIQVLQRTADGSEGSTLTFTSSASRVTVHTAYRISGWSSVEYSSVAEGLSNAPDSPALTPSAGLADYLWLTICGVEVGTLSSAPSNYSNFLAVNEGGLGQSIGSARRSLNASSEDPGGFTNSSAQSWVALTIAILPESGLSLVRVANETLRI